MRRFASTEIWSPLYLLGWICCVWTNVHAKTQPDVILIAIDDLRPMLGCYGESRIQTPAIDRIAARSVVFDRAYCQLAKCGPSRLSLMTGLRPSSIGVFGHSESEVNRFRARRNDAISFPRHLKDAGYETRSLGKIDHDGWQLETDWSAPPSPGREKEMLEIFDEAHPQGPSVIADRFDCPVSQAPDVADHFFFAGRMTAEAIAILEDREPDTPLFLALGFRRPHLPFVAPKRYFNLYQPDPSWLPSNPVPPLDSPVMAWFNSDGYVKAPERLGLTMPISPTRSEAIKWNGYELRSYRGVPPRGPISQDDQLALLHAYAACISYVDAQIGRFFEALESSGRIEQTILILLSDHGWHLGEASAWGKMTNFEIATRVPLLISAPGIEPGRTQTLAELVDVYPTLCDLVNLPVPRHLEGESLIGTLRNPRSERPNAVALSQYERFRGAYRGRALRTDRFRFVEWEEVATGKIVERELYDHTVDPTETTNLANLPEHSTLVETLESQLNLAFSSNSSPPSP